MIEKFNQIKAAMLLKKLANDEISTEELVRFNKKEGIIIFDIIKCMPLKETGLGLLIKGLIDLHGPGVIRTMRMAFKSDGYNDAKEALKIVGKEKAYKLINFWTELGYIEKLVEIKVGKNGDLKNTELNENFYKEFVESGYNTIIVRVKGSFSSLGYKAVAGKSNFPICVIEPAYIAGFIEATFDRRCDVDETKCEATGDDYCEYVFTLV
ncbi:MAG: V4R domain-containing protein [Candidatus Aenigmatarchaeota archaeon]